MLVNIQDVEPVLLYLNDKMASKYLMLHFREELIGTHDIQLCHKLWEDDSDIIIVLYVFQKVFQRRQFVPKVLGFVETIVSGYSNRDFVMDFRIEKQTFNVPVLVEKLRNILEYEKRSMGKPGLPPEKQLLYSRRCAYRVIGHVCLSVCLSIDFL